MVTVTWNGRTAFTAETPSGNGMTMDTHPEMGGENLGPTPLEAFLSALGACTAIDVVAILHKKQQKVTAYRVEIDGERGPQGEWPRPFLSLVVRHIVTGENIDPLAVARAVELSDTKYCSVSATIRHSPPITSEWKIEEAESAKP
jgi:putative redox protein